MNIWENHYQNFDKKKHPPAITLLNALKIYKDSNSYQENKLAIDLGCGNGIDTLALLEDNWNVLAIDNQKEALLRTKNKADVISQRLELRLSSFEDIDKLPACNLVNATFSLPFCAPGSFKNLWSIITSAIISKGIFCGQFFGINDSWSSKPEMTFHTKQQITELFNGFNIEYCQEIEREGKTISGKGKYWHVFHIVAQKK